MNEENITSNNIHQGLPNKQPIEVIDNINQQTKVIAQSSPSKMKQDQLSLSDRSSTDLILQSTLTDKNLEYYQLNEKQKKLKVNQGSDFEEENDEDLFSNQESSIINNSKMNAKSILHKNQSVDFKEKDRNSKSVVAIKKAIDISNFLPPANPLAPKIYSEDFNIYTAINIQFEKLPNFSKSCRYSFEEPEVSIKQIDQIQEKLNGEKPRTLFEYHNSIRDKLVYERHRNLDLLQNPTRIKDAIFFSSVLCKLSKLIRQDKKVFLQEQLKQDFQIRNIIKENAHKRKHQELSKLKQRTNEIVSHDVQSMSLSQQISPNKSMLKLNHDSSKSNQSINENTIETNQITMNNISQQIQNANSSNCNISNSNMNLNDNEISKQQSLSSEQTSSLIMQSKPNSETNGQQQQLQQSNIKKDSLVFSSEFESGNLFTAYQISENQYELILQNDINTKGNTQWFFFKVQNTKKNQTVTFTILNLIKSGSLFNNGLCPAVFSQKRMEESGAEWVREGFDIRYYKSNIYRDGFRATKYYSSLTFSYTFQHNQDTVYFAHSYPYTYSDLQEDLNKIMNDKQKNQHISKKNLCLTLSGNVCDLLTITSTSAKKRGCRKGIVIFARQHPGETGGSYMMKGVIDFLLGNSAEAEFLRDACIFKIVPMVNPDGVIHGNYRCDLAGADLNRRWKRPNKKLHPTVYALKEMIKKLHSERETKFILDLHGHSRKMEAFFYGCNYREDPLKTRIFPYLLSKINSKISFGESRFSMDTYKESTARITLWKELRAPNVFCLEASFYGYKQNQKNGASQDQKAAQRDNLESIASLRQKENKDMLLNPKQNAVNSSSSSGNKKAYHFTIQDYLDIGRDICINLYNLIQQEVAQKESSRGAFIIDQSSILHSQIQEIADNKELLESGNKSDSGSDSNPSEDDLDDEELLEIIPKNALSKKQKEIMNERLKKEKIDKKKGKVQVIQEQQNLNQQQEIKRKQTNQMYLQRYLQKQQEKLANNKGKQAQKKDQEQQTDSSFLYDLFLYMEKKKQFLLGQNFSEAKNEAVAPQNDQNQVQYSQEQLNNDLNSDKKIDSQKNQQLNSVQNNKTQNDNNNNESFPNLNQNPQLSIQNNSTKEGNNLIINKKALNNQNVNIFQSSSAQKQQQSQDYSPLGPKQSQNKQEDIQNINLNKFQGIKKGGNQYSFHNQRVKSLEQSNKNIQNPINANKIQQNMVQGNLPNFSEPKKQIQSRGQHSQRLFQRSPQENYTNSSNFLSKLQESQAISEQSPILLKKNNEFGVDRKREVSMSFSYANSTAVSNQQNSNYGQKSYYSQMENNILENNNNRGESGNKDNNIFINQRQNAIFNNWDYKNSPFSHVKQSVDLSSLKRSEMKINQNKEGGEINKIKIISNQKRLDAQHYSSVDFGQLQNNQTYKQSMQTVLENVELPNKNSFHHMQQIQIPFTQDLNNNQNAQSSFLPSINSPKQQILISNQRQPSDQMIQQIQNAQFSNIGKQSNNFTSTINLGLMNSFKQTSQLVLNQTNSITKSSFQYPSKDGIIKSQSVQVLLKAKQQISNKQKN